MIPSSDPRLTAYALGEMTPEERAAFEAELMKSEEAQRHVAEISSVAELLKDALANRPPLELGDEQRKKIEAAAEEAPISRKKPTERASTEIESETKVAPLRSSRLARAGGYAFVGAALAAAAAFAISISFPSYKKATSKSDDAKAKYEGGEMAPEELPNDLNRRYSPTATAYAAASSAPIAEPTEVQEDTDARTPGVPTGPAIPENPFVDTSKDPKSTFSIDVDTASYSIVRRLLESNQMPQPGNVRIEEMVNYFKFSYPEPNDAPFGVYADAATAPWETSHRLVRIGLKGRTVEMAKRPASNLVFLIDSSGSMMGADRLPLLKKGFELLVEQLDQRDTVSIVTYAGSSGLVLPPTSGSDKQKILASLDKLTAGGSTNGGSGIQLAYKTASDAFIQGGTNRVILATDGDFNVGVTSQNALVSMIEDKAKSGVFLSVLGFGLGNVKDGTMEKLADKGNGNYAYIDSMDEARRVLVQQASGTLITIAKDVKIQITFDPRTVQSFRLIGYENRVLEHKDFEDDKKDAGEIGAGHTVTALYEIVPTQNQGKGAHYADIALRYKMPDGTESRLVETTVADGGVEFSDASTDFRFAASVAGFGMLLRGSPHKGSLSYADVLKIASGALGDDPDGYRKQFVGLVSKASSLAK